MALVGILAVLMVWFSYSIGHHRGRGAGWRLARQFPRVRDLSAFDGG